jgi:hypothetical protein
MLFVNDGKRLIKQLIHAHPGLGGAIKQFFLFGF